MKKVTLALLCFGLIAAAQAQKIYFVYIQTEHHQPFFVRMNEKVYSSTASGYLILSKLIDSNYIYKVGFPGQNLDLTFATTINKKDHGYLLRNLGEKGWALIDLQTLSIQLPLNDSRSSADVKLDENVNAFTELLSRAADDSTLKYITVLKDEGKKPAVTNSDIIQPVVKVDVPLKTDETKLEQAKKVNPQQEKKVDVVKVDAEAEKKKEPVITDEQREKKEAGLSKETGYKKSEVTKIGQTTVADGLEIVYSDKGADKTDTITIVIDQSKDVVRTADREVENKSEKKFLDISTDSVRSNTRTPVTENKPVEIASDTMSRKPGQREEKKLDIKKLWPFNKNKNAAAEVKKCEAADNNDFLKLRRRMAARTNDDGMIEEARKYFKSKCFTTEQIRNLSSMFLSNAGKYHFFAAAYGAVVDKQNFSMLQSELKDEYYQARFREIVQNQ